MDIDIMDVIEAAATKWNFNVYYPGAGVGEHCLPVDPYYLVTKAEELGYHSKAITTGRGIKNSKVFVLGFSYKENVGEMLHHLRQRGLQIII